jgi:putative Holliday junction resolvase
MKLIGVDYGRRRIGLAMSDETGTIVRGLATLDRKVHPDVRGQLLAVVAREQPCGIVFGLPLGADGQETLMSGEIKRFAAGLEKLAAVPVHFIDESLTSKEASAILRFRKKKERRNKEAVDKIAACLILEAFLKENINK